MTFAEAVKRQMLQQGMNATELSERSGVSNPYISKLLNLSSIFKLQTRR